MKKILLICALFPVIALGVYTIGNALLFHKFNWNRDVTLEVYNVRKDPASDEYFAELILVNNTLTPVAYGGYSATAPLHTRRSLNYCLVRDRMSTWCGTDADSYVCSACRGEILDRDLQFPNDGGFVR